MAWEIEDMWRFLKMTDNRKLVLDKDNPLATKVQQKFGRKGKIISTKIANYHYPLAVLFVDDKGQEYIHQFTEQGEYHKGSPSDRDLINVPEEKEVVNCCVGCWGRPVINKLRESWESFKEAKEKDEPQIDWNKPLRRKDGLKVIHIEEYKNPQYPKKVFFENGFLGVYASDGKYCSFLQSSQDLENYEPEEEKPLPCPMCKQDPEILDFAKEIKCNNTNCLWDISISFRRWRTKHEAIKIWNTRAAQ